MPGAGSLAKCQCCCVDRLCSRGENRGVPPQLDGAVRHEPCRTAFSCRRAKNRRSYRVAARPSKNLVAFAPAGAGCKCGICAPAVHKLCAQQTAPPCQKVILFDSLKKPPLISSGGLPYFCSVNWRAAAPRGAQAAAATAAAAKTRPPSPRRYPDAAAACRRRTRANSTRR